MLFGCGRDQRVHIFQFKCRWFFGCDDPLYGAAGSSSRDRGSIGPCGVKNFIRAGKTARGHKTSQDDCFDGVFHRVDDQKHVSIPENEDLGENNFRRRNRLTEDSSMKELFGAVTVLISL